jgi:ABC-2 type transport system permease protein
MIRRDSDRGSWLLVTRREFWVRLRDRGFLISTSITIVVLSGFIVASSVGGSSTPSFDLAVTESAGSIQPSLAAVAHERDVDLAISVVADDAAARRDVLAGVADAAISGETLLVKNEPAPALQDVVAEAQRRSAISEQLSGTGLSDEQIGQVLDPPALHTVALGDVPSEDR